MKFTSSVPQVRLLMGILLVAGLYGCGKKDVNPNAPLNPDRAYLLSNESYGPGNRQVADVHLPANRTGQTPVMLLLHGGGWSEGDKRDMEPLIREMKSRWPQLAIVNMNYRLANGLASNFHPAQMQDIAAALQWMDSRSSAWTVSNKYILTGVSAGGHLAALYAYAFDTPRKLRAVVAAVAPSDFTDPFYTGNGVFQQLITAFLGKNFQQDPDLHRDASPALRVTLQSPPSFLAYAGQDLLVPITNGRRLRDRLQQAGVQHSYHEYPAEGHDLSPAAIDDVLLRMTLFLQPIVQQ